MSYFSEYNRWDEGGGAKVFCIFATQEDTFISYHAAIATILFFVTKRHQSFIYTRAPRLRLLLGEETK
jgi:hypothetical protein